MPQTKDSRSFVPLIVYGLGAASKLHGLPDCDETVIADSRAASVSNVTSDSVGPVSLSLTADESASAKPESIPIGDSVRIDEWSERLETEFSHLARKEACGTISEDQAARLDLLNEARDRLLQPRSPEEILLQMRRDRIVADLAAALDKYVQFQKGSS